MISLFKALRRWLSNLSRHERTTSRSIHYGDRRVSILRRNYSGGYHFPETVNNNKYRKR